jgi:hypothetical protein
MMATRDDRLVRQIEEQSNREHLDSIRYHAECLIDPRSQRGHHARRIKEHADELQHNLEDMLDHRYA